MTRFLASKKYGAHSRVTGSLAAAAMTYFMEMVGMIIWRVAAKNDKLVGGLGTDAASYQNASGGVTVNLSTGTATGADGNDTLNTIEQVYSSGFDDFLLDRR